VARLSLWDWDRELVFPDTKTLGRAAANVGAYHGLIEGIVLPWVDRCRTIPHVLRRTKMNASEAQEAVGAEDFLCRKAAGATRCTLR
jgi:hypothetical protein